MSAEKERESVQGDWRIALAQCVQPWSRQINLTICWLFSSGLLARLVINFNGFGLCFSASLSLSPFPHSVLHCVRDGLSFLFRYPSLGKQTQNLSTVCVGSVRKFTIPAPSFVCHFCLHCQNVCVQSVCGVCVRETVCSMCLWCDKSQ